MTHVPGKVEIEGRSLVAKRAVASPAEVIYPGGREPFRVANLPFRQLNLAPVDTIGVPAARAMANFTPNAFFGNADLARFGKRYATR